MTSEEGFIGNLWLAKDAGICKLLEKLNDKSVFIARDDQSHKRAKSQHDQSTIPESNKLLFGEICRDFDFSITVAETLSGVSTLSLKTAASNIPSLLFDSDCDYVLHFEKRSLGGVWSSQHTTETIFGRLGRVELP